MLKSAVARLESLPYSTLLKVADECQGIWMRSFGKVLNTLLLLCIRVKYHIDLSKAGP